MTTFDIHWRIDGPQIEYHFCREWGCYGSNPDHGFTLDDAIEEVASYFEEQAKLYRLKSHPDLDHIINPPEDTYNEND